MAYMMNPAAIHVETAARLEEGVQMRVFGTGLGETVRYARALPGVQWMEDGLSAGTFFINLCNDAPVEVPFGDVESLGVGRGHASVAKERYPQLKSDFERMDVGETPF